MTEKEIIKTINSFIAEKRQEIRESNGNLDNRGFDYTDGYDNAMVDISTILVNRRSTAYLKGLITGKEPGEGDK